jgi:hypothetical protein
MTAAWWGGILLAIACAGVGVAAALGYSNWKFNQAVQKVCEAKGGTLVRAWGSFVCVKLERL